MDRCDLFSVQLVFLGALLVITSRLRNLEAEQSDIVSGRRHTAPTSDSPHTAMLTIANHVL
jgi:hypothetical protein